MGNRPWLIFDYDDTLGGVLVDQSVQNNEVAYLRAQEEFESYMESLGFDRAQAASIRKETDEYLCSTYGFAWKHRYAESMVRTYKALASKTNRTPIPAEATKSFMIGASVFEHRYMPLPGALRTLHALKPEYNIAIVTKGEREEQHKKVTHSGVGFFADKIIVVGFKNRQEWVEVLDELGIHTEDQFVTSWAIGNSPKSDVNVPLSMGLNAIHVDQGGWDFEKEPYVTPQDGRKLYTVPTIADVLTLIPWS